MKEHDIPTLIVFNICAKRWDILCLIETRHVKSPHSYFCLQYPTQYVFFLLWPYIDFTFLEFLSSTSRAEMTTILKAAKSSADLSLDDYSLLGSAVIELFCGENGGAEAYQMLCTCTPKDFTNAQKYRLINIILGKLGLFETLKLCILNILYFIHVP